MKGFGKTIGLFIFLICISSVKACSSTDKIQTYISRGSSLTMLSSSELNLLQSGYSNLLFAQQTNDSVKIRNFSSRKLKSPWIAFGIALVPGFVVHGAGHFYAGRIGTGLLLLGTEVVGMSLLVYAAVSSIALAWGGEYDPEAELWAIGGLVLFMGSWICDMVGSPLAVKKQNEKLLQGKQGNLKFQMKDGQLKLVIMKNF